MSTTLHTGDCLLVMADLANDSIDAIVTDPPYGLHFMGKAWDKGVPGVEFWQQMLRVAKPGAYLLAFGGSRTSHRMACAIEDAGWEIRDTIMWLYGSGFPKSLDVSKAIDKAAGAERVVVGSRIKAGIGGSQTFAQDAWTQANRGPIELAITEAATDAAKRWQGWGTALKPAHEPIIMARKPLVGTVAANVLAYGTGALNIDLCRVGVIGGTAKGSRPQGDGRGIYGAGLHGACEIKQLDAGRWPANVIHDGSEEVLAGFPDSNAGKSAEGLRGRRPGGFGGVGAEKGDSVPNGPQYGDAGSAARFFYCAKASKADRGEGNTHPTVKPTALMRYLVRLVTPRGGTILDPFAGSGSTGKAAALEWTNFIGIELEAEYAAIAERRIAHAEQVSA